MISWSDQYKIGVQEIDEQHKHFFYLLENMFRAKKREVMGQLCTIEEYAEIHFKTEEKLMGETNYLDLRSHQLAHNLFKQRLKRFRNIFLKGDDEVSQKLYDYIREWVVQHILIEDRKYRSHFFKHGLCEKGGFN